MCILLDFSSREMYNRTNIFEFELQIFVQKMKIKMGRGENAFSASSIVR